MQVVGKYLHDSIASLEAKYSPLIANTRGLGTLIAFDVKTTAIRDQMVRRIRDMGVEIGGCGSTSIRLRPALTMQPKHAVVFLDILDELFNEFKNKK